MKEHFNVEKGRGKYKYVIFLMLSLLFLVTLAINFSLGEKHTVRIEGTGQKQEVSYGTDIRIKAILRNNEVLTSKDVKLSGSWEETDGSFVAIKANTSTWIEIPFYATDTVEIELITQCGSGFVTIYKDGQEIEEKDLYAENYSYIDYSVNLGEPKTKAQEILPWLALIEGLVLECYLISLLLRRFRNQLKDVKWMNLFLYFANAVVLYISVEVVNNNLFNVLVPAMAGNILLYFVLIIITSMLIPKKQWGAIVVSVAFLLFSIANFYVTVFRGSPIMPGDFLTIRAAANVADGYTYNLNENIIWACILLVCFFAMSSFFFQKHAWKVKRKIFAVVFCMISLFGMVVYAGTLKVNLWNLQANVKDYGIGIGLIANMTHMRLEDPEIRDSQKIESILDAFKEEDSEFNPNIIVIMNEAFSDLSAIYPELDSDLYMSYFNALTDNVVKGTAVSSVRGGHTANSEYEFLTGNSMYFMKGHVPYQQHIYNDTYSLVSVLKDRGYEAVAIHPYTASGYNRPTVYEHFAFDDFLTIDDFSEYELVRKRYISDKDSYEKVIEVFEAVQDTSDPVFIFNVTMQNHGPYETGYYGDDVIRVPGMEGEYPEVEEYLRLVKQSDETISVLVDYFSGIEEPTVILLFGDHQPNLTMDGSVSVQSKYEVPFVIWANYDIEEEYDMYTSLNYLSAIMFDRTGISCTSYQNYLLDLSRTIPAISAQGYLGLDEKWYRNSQDQEITEKLEQYWSLEYYHMFEKQ